MKGKGLDLPDLPDLGDPTAPMTVQLIQSTSDTCWQSVFDGADVIKDDGVLFKAIDQ